MAAVYRFTSSEGIELVVPAPTTEGALVQVAGVRQGASWRSPPVELVQEEDGAALTAVDWPFLSSALPVVKDEALPRVTDLLAPYAEFLPLSCPQVPLTAINVLAVVDALDESASVLTALPTGRIVFVDRYVFAAARLPRDGLFKLPRYLQGTLLSGTDSAAAAGAWHRRPPRAGMAERRVGTMDLGGLR